MTMDWAIPQQAKLKYTQLFNLHDRARSGFLSGLQCRDILLQSGLPRNILAEIWNLSDIDGDGQLTREEFILAMHLTNQVRTGQALPSELPADLVPPSYRRTRSISATSVNSASSGGTSASGNIADPNLATDLAASIQQLNQKPQSVTGSDSAASSFAAGSVLYSNSFEDKRRENYERGRAELERRRLKVIEQQAAILKDQLASCKKQVAEAKGKIDSMRSERDTKMGLITSLEAQLQAVRERKTYLDHEEQNILAIAKDLNLVQPNSNQAELDQLATQAKKQNIEMMKVKLKEFEKENSEKKEELEETKKRLDESKSELRTLIDDVKTTFDNYKEKVANAKILREQFMNENKSKTVDLDSVWDSAPSFGNTSPLNNNNTSNNFNDTISTAANNQSTISQPIESATFNSNDDPWASTNKGSNDQPFSFTSPAVATSNDEFGNAFATTSTRGNQDISSQTSAFDDGFGATSTLASATSIMATPADSLPGEDNSQLGKIKKFRALYAFEARNHDELTINPGDIIVGSDVVCEPGWLSGSCNGQNGLFPESYVELLPDDMAESLNVGVAAGIAPVATASIGAAQSLASPFAGSAIGPTAMPKYKVIYAFEARNTDELTINPGDIITGVEGVHEPGWLMGELNGAKGLFPEAYVEKMADTEPAQSSQQEQQPEAGGKSRAKRAEVATVIANYRALGQEQLSLEKGQLVLIRRKMDSGWWEGEIQVKDDNASPNGQLLQSKSSIELKHLVSELIISESDYICDLRLCQSAYIEPLSSASSFDLVQHIFLNWNHLIEMHASSLNKLFQKETSNYIYVFETFRSLIGSIGALYIEFCTHQTENTRKLDAKIASDLRFKQLVNDAGRQLKRSLELAAQMQQQVTSRLQRYSNLPLTSYMLKPMQRITKYSLLFDRIHKILSETQLYELKSEVESLKNEAQSLCQQVNEACRIRDDFEDNKQKLRWAQTHIIQQVYGAPSSQDSLTLQNFNDTISLASIASGSELSARLSNSPLTISSTSMTSQYSTAPSEFIQFDSITNYLGSRKLLKAGSLTKLNSGRELVAFLANDFLMLTTIKGGLVIREEDIFKSEKAKQAYYKLYRNPILLEDIVMLQSSNELAINQQVANGTTWIQPIALDSLSTLTFRDTSTSEMFNLVAVNSKERDIWFKELDRRSQEARELRVEAQIKRALRPLRKSSIHECFGRLFITVIELKFSRSAYFNSNSIANSPIDTMRKNSTSSLANQMNLCVQLQLKRMKQQAGNLDLASIINNNNDTLNATVKRETIPLSEAYKTIPVPSFCLGSPKYLEYCAYSIEPNEMDGRDLIRFNDATCTQLLLENKQRNSPFNINLLDISLVDESKFRESQLLARRRVNLDQMLGLESYEQQLHSTAKQQNDTHSSLRRNHSLRLEPNRPVEYAFKLKPSLSKRRLISNATSLLDDSNIISSNVRCDVSSISENQPETSVKLRLHLQLFNSNNHNSPSANSSQVPISPILAL